MAIVNSTSNDVISISNSEFSSVIDKFCTGSYIENDNIYLVFNGLMQNTSISQSVQWQANSGSTASYIVKERAPMKEAYLQKISPHASQFDSPLVSIKATEKSINFDLYTLGAKISEVFSYTYYNPSFLFSFLSETFSDIKSRVSNRKIIDALVSGSSHLHLPDKLTDKDVLNINYTMVKNGNDKTSSAILGNNGNIEGSSLHVYNQNQGYIVVGSQGFCNSLETRANDEKNGNGAKTITLHTPADISRGGSLSDNHSQAFVGNLTNGIFRLFFDSMIEDNMTSRWFLVLSKHCIIYTDASGLNKTTVKPSSFYNNLYSTVSSLFSLGIQVTKAKRVMLVTTND